MGIRDLVLTFLGWGCVPLALYNSYYGVLGYVWLSVMKPQSLVWSASVADSRMAFAVMIALLAKFFFFSDEKIRFTRPMIWFFLLWGWFALCALSSNYISQSLSALLDFSKIIIGPFLVTCIITNMPRFRGFIALLAACTGFYALKMGLFLFTGGTTVHGGPMGLDNNDTALFIAMGIPLLLYVGLELKGKWLKRGYLLAAALSGPAVIATSSRGGMLSMALAFGLVIWLRFKTAKTFLLIPAVAIALYSVMPASVLQRYQTIDDYEVDSSAVGRISAWKTATNIANHNLFGAGFGQDAYLAMYPQYQTTEEETPRAAHSAWFQLLGESGYLGLVLFLALIITTAKLGLSLRKKHLKGIGNEEIGRYADMLLVTLAVYIVGATFLSQARFEFFYYVLAAIGCLHNISQSIENGDNPITPVRDDIHLHSERF